MNKLTFEEIKAIIESDIFKQNSYYPRRWMTEDVYTSLDEIEKYGQEFKDEFAKLGKIEMIEQFGGEGKGDDYFTVYHFVDHAVYISFNGWYASHIGPEYDGMSQVTPKIVEKIEWVKVK